MKIWDNFLYDWNFCEHYCIWLEEDISLEDRIRISQLVREEFVIRNYIKCKILDRNVDKVKSCPGIKCGQKEVSWTAWDGWRNKDDFDSFIGVKG